MLINREFLMTALPAALITFAFSFLLKTKSRKEAIRRGMAWTGVFVLMYILIGIGNHVVKRAHEREGLGEVRGTATGLTGPEQANKALGARYHIRGH